MSVWAPALWAAGVWAAGVWYEDGAPQEEPQQQVQPAVPGLFRNPWLRLHGRTHVEHYPQGGFALHGAADVVFERGQAPVEPVVEAPAWEPHALHEPDYAAAQITLAKARKRKDKVRRADMALLGIS